MNRALFATLLLLWSHPSAQANGWERLDSKEGITVYERQVPGRSLPAFRGEAEVSAALAEVLAVLADTTRRTEWMHRCVEARQLERRSQREVIVYNRTSAPWPVSDRDVVLHSSVEVKNNGDLIMANFRATTHAAEPPKGDAVRMRTLEGHFRLTRLGDARTHVQYQVSADPAGMLPGWLARRATRELPLITLRNLRRQIERRRRADPDFGQRWAATLTPETRRPDDAPSEPVPAPTAAVAEPAPAPAAPATEPAPAPTAAE